MAIDPPTQPPPRTERPASASKSTYFVIGAVVVVALIAGFLFMNGIQRDSADTMQAPATGATESAVPATPPAENAPTEAAPTETAPTETTPTGNSGGTNP